MPIGDGATWDETTPTDATQAVQIDDYLRDVRVGVRARMANEHEWPSSQSATSQAGAHKFITLQAQASLPALAGTQIGAVYLDTNNNLVLEKSNGSTVLISSGTCSGIQGFGYNSKYAYLNFSGVSTAAILSSMNVSSISRIATGSYQVNFSITMADTGYAALLTAMGGDSSPRLPFVVSKSTTGLTFAVGNIFGSQADATQVTMILVGT